ncbi:hypothetical protein HDV01_000405 [Terramyces sp. JEL0728]|nr:hypothetical protein HDV01_000405 [Terramyces sp. JEL0728]
MQSGMGQSTALGYSIQISKQDSSYSVQLVHGNPSSVYQGILLYVTASGDTKTHLGNFTAFDTSKFKSVKQKSCTRDGVAGTATATITHANPSNYIVGSGTNFTWTPNAGDFTNGDLALTAVVAAFTKDTAKKPTWQHLGDTPISE